VELKVKNYQTNFLIMKNAYNQFLDALSIFSDPIRTWTNALRKNNIYNTGAQLKTIPVHVKRYFTIAVFALALSACGERRSTEQQRSSDMQTMGTDESHLDEREQSDIVPGVGAQRTIEMEAKDHVYFPREISAQPGEQFYVNLVNGGNEDHNIQIDLGQAPLTFGEPVPIGQSRKLLVKAPNQPGRYQIFCPVKDHRQKGMIATLIVE
jgi:plastocyanin